MKRHRRRTIMDDIVLNKNDYRMLNKLMDSECYSPMESLTLKALSESTNMSISNLRIIKSNFLLMGLIKEGAKDGNSKTYYITEKGENHVKKAFGITDINEE